MNYKLNTLSYKLFNIGKSIYEIPNKNIKFFAEMIITHGGSAKIIIDDGIGKIVCCDKIGEMSFPLTLLPSLLFKIQKLYGKELENEVVVFKGSNGVIAEIYLYKEKSNKSLKRRP